MQRKNSVCHKNRKKGRGTGAQQEAREVGVGVAGEVRGAGAGEWGRTLGLTLSLVKMCGRV